MDGVFRQIERVSKSDVPRRQLDLRSERFLSARRQYNGAMSTNAQLQLTQKAGVIVEEPDIGSARRIDVPGDGGGEKRFANHQREVVDLTRLERLVGYARFHMMVGY